MVLDDSLPISISATSIGPSETTYCRCASRLATRTTTRSQLITRKKLYPPRSHPKQFELVERRERFELTSWLPAAAEGAVKLDDGVELSVPRARKYQFSIKKVLVSDQNFKIVGQSGVIAQSREAGSIPAAP